MHKTLHKALHKALHKPLIILASVAVGGLGLYFLIRAIIAMHS